MSLLGVNSVSAQKVIRTGGLTYVTEDQSSNSVKVLGETNNNQTEIIIPETIEYEGVNYKVTGIGENAFINWSSLVSITIPNSVTNIGYMAFFGCASLTSVTIPDGVTDIENFAFSNCTSLSSVTMSNSVTNIRDCIFYGCTNLVSITLSNNLTNIESSTFWGCSSLASITIPNSVTSIGYHAFEGCTGLTSMTVEAIVPPIYDEIGVSKELPIYVPEESVSAYKSADGWKDLNIIGVAAGIGGVNIGNADKAVRKILHNGRVIIRKADKNYGINGIEMKK